MRLHAGASVVRLPVKADPLYVKLPPTMFPHDGPSVSGAAAAMEASASVTAPSSTAEITMNLLLTRYLLSRLALRGCGCRGRIEPPGRDGRPSDDPERHLRADEIVRRQEAVQQLAVELRRPGAARHAPRRI